MAERLREQNHFGERAFCVVAVAAYASILAVASFHHTLWHDELQAWLIARDSVSIASLFRNLAYEATPGLWHLCLYWLTRFTHDPSSMKILHFVIAVGALFVFVRFAPFSKLQRAVWCLGYFPLYEYAVINRSYVLGLLLTFCFCVLLTRQKINVVLVAISLALLANSSVLGLIVAISLCPILAIRWGAVQMFPLSGPSRWPAVLAALIVMFAVGAAVYQTVPPQRPSNTRKAAAHDTLKSRAQNGIIQVWNGYVPIPVPRTDSWDINVYQMLPHGGRLAALISVFLVGVSIWLLRDAHAIAASYCIGVLGVMAVGYQYGSVVRHAGFTFVLFIACVWLRRSLSQLGFLPKSAKGGRIDARTPSVIWAMLAVQAAAGLLSIGRDFTAPFSASKGLADFITRRHLQGMLIAGTPDYAVSPLTAYLDKPVFLIDANRFGTFVTEHPQIQVSTSQATEELRTLALLGRPTLLVTNVPFVASAADVHVFPVATFAHAILRSETYHLYRVSVVPHGKR